MASGVHLVLVCGLPATGKTSWVKNLTKEWEANEREGRVVHIDYDDVFADIGGSVECFEEQKWKDNRAECAQRVQAAVEAARSDHSLNLIVVDDNMYYRSMRHAFWKMARDFQVAFVQVYFDVRWDDGVPILSEVLQRNAGRSGAAVVPEDVIITMAEKLEVPDGSKHRWEEATVVVPPIECRDAAPTLEDVLARAVVPGAAAVGPSEEEREQDRQATRTCVLDQLEVAIRKSISTQLKELKISGADSSQMKQASRELSDEKRHIVQEVKQGKHRRDSDLNGEVAWLVTLFESRCASLANT